MVYKIRTTRHIVCLYCISALPPPRTATRITPPRHRLPRRPPRAAAPSTAAPTASTRNRGAIQLLPTLWERKTISHKLVVRENPFRNLLAKSRLEVNCPPARAEQRGGRAGRAGEGDRRCRGDRLGSRRPRGQFSVSGGQLS